MPKPTMKELGERARRAIERREAFVYDVAAESGQIVGNVAGMRWFVREVARWLTLNVKRWQHLTIREI